MEVPASAQPVAGATYAGFWKRFAAYIVDVIALIVIGIIVRLILHLLHAPGGIYYPVGIVIYWLYFAYQESSVKQATLGKQALGIKVTDLEGNRISFARATGRYFAKYVSSFILMIGWIMAAFTEKKQALHDMIASTLVVNAR